MVKSKSRDRSDKKIESDLQKISLCELTRQGIDLHLFKVIYLIFISPMSLEIDIAVQVVGISQILRQILFSPRLIYVILVSW